MARTYSVEETRLVKTGPLKIPVPDRDATGQPICVGRIVEIGTAPFVHANPTLRKMKIGGADQECFCCDECFDYEEKMLARIEAGRAAMLKLLEDLKESGQPQ